MGLMETDRPGRCSRCHGNTVASPDEDGTWLTVCCSAFLLNEEPPSYMEAE